MEKVTIDYKRLCLELEKQGKSQGSKVQMEYVIEYWEE